MGNQTISSYGGDKISEITESIKIMHESMESMKQEIVSLKNKRKTENGETSSKRIKLMEAENGASGPKIRTVMTQ
jgi:Ni,Fe-hydrogenase III large subunit